MKRKTIVSILFTIGACLLLFPYSIRYYHNLENQKSYDMLKRDSNKLSDDESKELKAKVTHCNETSRVNTGEVVDPFSSNKENLTNMKNCLGMDQDNVFAILEIPALDLVVPIYLSASEEFLSKGIGLVDGSSLPIGGNSTHTVLAGHRGLWTQEMLMHADKIQMGNFFYIHTLIETLEYRVYDKQVIYPEDTGALEVQEGKDLATIITCHPFGSNAKRLLIHGERV